MAYLTGLRGAGVVAPEVSALKGSDIESKIKESRSDQDRGVIVCQVLLSLFRPGLRGARQRG